MEFIESSNFFVIDEPFDDINIIRQRSISIDVDDDEPFYMCNISDIINKHQIWKRHLPRIRPFYAVKCNDSPVVIQTLANLGTGFDCASKGEIAKVMKYEVPPQSIIYAHPTKLISHLKYAVEMNVSVMTVDSDFEIHKVKKYYPDAKLVLRIRFDAKLAFWPLGKKFGCCPDIEARDLIKLAKKLKLNMIGISFHVGSGCMDSSAYANAIQVSRNLFDFAKKVGYHFTLLDIGGGFLGDSGTDIKEIASAINHSIDVHFSSSDVTIIAEPGQFYVASAYTLVCRVHSKREIRQDGHFKSVMYFINDGVFGSFFGNKDEYKSAHPITLKSDSEEKYISSVWGPTMDSIDQVCENVLLPRLNIGDFIIFKNMGAYTIPIACNFNGFPLPKIEYYIERKHSHRRKCSLESSEAK